MELVLIILALLCIVAGMVGSVLPALPGPPLAWVAMLLMRWACGPVVSTTHIVVSGVAMLLVTLFDFVAPLWLTKLGGGSRQAKWGTTIGLMAGLFFFPPWGIVVGPFVGALVGELVAGANSGKALGVALLSFVAFLLTTGLKLIYCAVLLYLVFYYIFVC